MAHFPGQSCQGLGLHRLFVVPTATFRILFVLVVLAQDRRRVVHFNVSALPPFNAKTLPRKGCRAISPAISPSLTTFSKGDT